MKALVSAFGAGSLFAIGLMLGGMTQPSKVVGFLDVGGAWDPSLIFVMGAAIATYLPLFWWLTRRGLPLFAAQYLIPKKGSVDMRLAVGASLFGAGWGLAGYCPGPALVSAGAGLRSAVVFSVAMLVGMVLHQAFESVLRSSRARLSLTPREASQASRPTV